MTTDDKKVIYSMIGVSKYYDKKPVLKNIYLSYFYGAKIGVLGLNGSGKSSLAFDTIYAEGQRKYVESLSAYARQFLQQMQKPDVDHITGLSPAIAIGNAAILGAIGILAGWFPARRAARETQHGLRQTAAKRCSRASAQSSRICSAVASGLSSV